MISGEKSILARSATICKINAKLIPFGSLLFIVVIHLLFKVLFQNLVIVSFVQLYIE